MLTKCRARLEDQPCMHGGRVLDPDDYVDDGTYDERDGTIICDVCYIAIMPFTRSGQALHHELDTAVIHYREQLIFVRAHDDLDVLVAMATEKSAESRLDSPLWRSARACAQMAIRERERRGT